MKTVNALQVKYGMHMEKRKHIHKSLAKKLIWSLFRLVLLVGISFVILFPFIIKFSSAFMSDEDLVDKTVKLVPRAPTLDNIQFVIDYTKYYEALINTTMVSLLCGLLQMTICMLVGYGLAKFKFKGKGLVFALVIFTIIVPPQTILISLYMKFRFFDVYGLVSLIKSNTVNLLDSLWPMLVISVTGFGFKNGLFIFIMRQFFKGVPDELEEAAYVDGAGVFRTFIKIMVPLSTPIMVTVFLFVVSWQWTDIFYSNIFFKNFRVLPNIVFAVTNVNSMGVFAGTMKSSTLVNTAALLVLSPMVVIYMFAQKKLIQGIERSGIVG